MTPEERAHLTCRRHNERHPTMGNVPIQSVYEWLVAVQREAIAEEREAILALISSPDLVRDGRQSVNGTLADLTAAIRARGQS